MELLLLVHIFFRFLSSPTFFWFIFILFFLSFFYAELLDIVFKFLCIFIISAISPTNMLHLTPNLGWWSFQPSSDFFFFFLTRKAKFSKRGKYFVLTQETMPLLAIYTWQKYQFKRFMKIKKQILDNNLQNLWNYKKVLALYNYIKIIFLFHFHFSY